mgnify:CR=1 FL=1
MSRNRLVGISLLVVSLLASSFFVGTLYTSYTGIERYGRIDFTTPETSIGAVTEVSKGAQHQQAFPTVEERMVIYDGYVSLETSDIPGNLAKIRSLVESYGGYVAGSSRTHEYAEIIIRVPKEKFRASVEEIETYGKVLDERTSSEDVTEQYVDLKARLENLQRQERRLQEILEMAKTVDDVLTVERELERVRGEIESLQGQINYLERNVAMSVISVYLSKPPPPFTPPGMNWNETVETALIVLFAVIRGLVILVISTLPLAIIGIVVYYVYRRKKRKKQESA